MQQSSQMSDQERVLTLDGHTSLSELLYERDSLAVALAAEKRRSAEFEQLWRRSYAEVDQRKQAPTAKEKELWRAELAEGVIRREMEARHATSADLQRTIEQQMHAGSLSVSNAAVQLAKIKVEELRIAEAESVISNAMNLHQLSSDELRRTIDEQKVKGSLDESNAILHHAEIKFEALRKAEAEKSRAVEKIQEVLAAERSRSAEFEQLWRRAQSELDELKMAAVTRKEQCGPSEDKQRYWSEANMQLASLLREQYKHIRGSESDCEDKYFTTLSKPLPEEPAAEPILQADLVKPPMTTPLKVNPSAEIAAVEAVSSNYEQSRPDKLGDSCADFKLKIQDMVITGPPFVAQANQ